MSISEYTSINRRALFWCDVVAWSLQLLFDLAIVWRFVFGDIPATNRQMFPVVLAMEGFLLSTFWIVGRMAVRCVTVDQAAAAENQSIDDRISVILPVILKPIAMMVGGFLMTYPAIKVLKAWL